VSDGLQGSEVPHPHDASVGGLTAVMSKATLISPLQEIEWVILTISRVEVGGAARLKLCFEAWRSWRRGVRQF
jgi:hypothetical protein